MKTPLIRSAQQGDKHSVLEFCKDTFSWGDYIADVWDSWQSKGGLYVSEQDGLVVGVYNVAFFEKEAWLEGMRVRPQYRKKGLGKKMLAHAESVIQNGTVRLVIESENHQSIALVTSMGYGLEEKWRLYSMIPEKQASNATVANTSRGLDEFLTTTTFADSWKWLPLDREEMEKLVEQKRVLVSHQNDKISSIGIWNRSKDFPEVFQLGFVNGTKEGMADILRYAQNKAHEIGCQRIQVFAQEKISLEASFLEKKSLFYLMKKELKEKSIIT
ncbi:MAG TPA: GNAT family N-acetyltransferase [Candidatus Nitrosotalea sp.]|nr:GNAT family N-acetyltransferase [Candidatus Nitrosotalea sp.]